jgi:hypothetical protein
VTSTRFRTKHGSALTAIYLMARLNEEDAGKMILTVPDCKEVVATIARSRYEEKRYGYEKGFQECLDLFMARPWYKRIRL